jgi:hypothetical protein
MTEIVIGVALVLLSGVMYFVGYSVGRRAMIRDAQQVLDAMNHVDAT